MLAMSGIVLVSVAVGLLRILRGPPASRVMAAQLLGTGGVAALLLQSAALQVPAIVDAALILALLAAFASVTFVSAGAGSSAPEVETSDRG